MIEPKIVETDLEFTNLSERYTTDLIVIHHTGNPYDDDLSAEEIHESHQALGWAGIGYHYVIRKNGTIEAGRPEWAIGSHHWDNFIGWKFRWMEHEKERCMLAIRINPFQ